MNQDPTKYRDRVPSLGRTTYMWGNRTLMSAPFEAPGQVDSAEIVGAQAVESQVPKPLTEERSNFGLLASAVEPLLPRDEA